MSTPRSFAITPPDMRFPALIMITVLLVCVGALAMSWR